jgi:hypothetical protein
MSIRREPTYLSTEVWRALRLLAKSKHDPNISRVVTADEVADRMLADLIEKDYPQLFEHQKQVEKLERELINTL